MAALVLGIEPQVDGLPQAERRGIRVREAGPFLQLMNLPLDEEDSNSVRRLLPSREVLKPVADACNLVHLLQDPLLPSLRRLPTDAAHLLMMDSCALKLTEYARAAGGGSFGVACTEFAGRIGSYTADARGHPGRTTDVSSLRDSIEDLLNLASRFLDTTCTPGAAEAEA